MLGPFLAAIVIVWFLSFIGKSSTNDKENSNGKRK